MNAADMFVGLVAGSGGKEGKLWDMREDVPEKVDGFRQVFARAVEEVRGNDRPPRPDSPSRAAPAKRQVGSESSTARSETASRPERKPAEETLETARKLLRAIIHRLEKDKEKLAEELPDEQLIAMLMNLIALLLAGDEDESLEFLKELGWLQEGETVIDLKVSVEGIADEGIAVGETEELLAALQQWLEEAEAEKAGQLKLLIRLSEDEAVSIPLDRFNPEAEGEAQIVLNLTADAEEAPVCLVVNASCAEQAEVVALDAEVPQDAKLLLSLAGSQEELLEEGAPDEKSKVFGLEVLKALRQQTAEGSAKSRPSLMVPLEMQGRGEANVQSLSPEVRDFLMALLQKATEGNVARGGPEVSTANPMLMATDEYLQVLDYLTFLQGLAGKAQGRTLGERLALLTGVDGEEGFSLSTLLLKGTQPGDRLVEKLLEDMRGDDATKRWRSEVFEARAARLSNGSRAARNLNNTSEQIPFLPRTATESFSLSDVVNRAAEAMPKPSQVAPQDVVNQVVQRISYTFFNGNGGEVRVFLRPEHLGELQVKVRLEHEVMVAKFVAQSDEVKAIIENNLGQLKDALDQQGIKVAKMEVSLGNNFEEQTAGDLDQEASEQANRAQLPGETAAAYEEGLFDGAEAYYGNTEVYTTSISQVNYFA